MEKTGRALDGSAFAEKTLARYAGPEGEVREVQNRAGETSLRIGISGFPDLILRATMPDRDGNFSLISLDYLAGNEHGWNEFSLELFGGGTFLERDSDFVLSVPEFLPLHLRSGRIRRYDTRIAGDRALDYLNNRYQRILALSEWMLTLDAPKVSGPEAFRSRFGPLLFPELVPARARPEGWLREGDRRRRAENVNWNLDYTERTFPEELWNVRNSGTLLRDWEEAGQWIYLRYRLDDLVDLLARGIAVTKQ
ncbi:MAG: hypothetical protein FWD94_02400 [Treponema sp.]|nr:hypothetical protein [Treponema sp.]